MSAPLGKESFGTIGDEGVRDRARALDLRVE